MISKIKIKRDGSASYIVMLKSINYVIFKLWIIIIINSNLFENNIILNQLKMDLGLIHLNSNSYKIIYNFNTNKIFCNIYDVLKYKYLFINFAAKISENILVNNIKKERNSQLQKLLWIDNVFYMYVGMNSYVHLKNINSMKSNYHELINFMKRICVYDLGECNWISNKRTLIEIVW